MENLDKFLEGKDFETKDKEAEAFPTGKTRINLKTLEVEERTIEFEDGAKTRYILKDGDKSYWAGNQVMTGIKAARDLGADEADVLKQGSGLKTSYMVVAVE